MKTCQIPNYNMQTAFLYIHTISLKKVPHKNNTQVNYTHPLIGIRVWNKPCNYAFQNFAYLIVCDSECHKYTAMKWWAGYIYGIAVL